MKIDPSSWPAVSRLLDQWLELPEEARAGWLETLGPEHANSIPMLRQLIAAQRGVDAQGFLNTLPGVGRSTGMGEALEEFRFPGLSSGALVGPYRLVRELGQGGMGVVWLAERADGAIRRQVALKLPIVSFPDRTLAERFTLERDILARLTHPNIARLYDGGITDRGQPYLVMEYVEGEKITGYCDQNKLGVRPRLRLFLQVLRAAQYAHANLVVHRDLKPANILVTRDGDVRLLDFGIAKLLAERRAGENELTRLEGRALTPDYASPEQIAGDAITTASDVYSLGVVLYELLTGARPYKLRRDTRSGLEDAILAAAVSRPSQSVDDDHAANVLGSTPARVARSLKGDLDTIVLKALAREPAQRFATADAFAQDIERYLKGEVLLARPESAWYRSRKFVLRNKLAVASAVAVAAALSIGLGVALREAHIAQVQTRTSEAVRTFLLDLFRANSNQNPDPVRARETTARQLLDIGAGKINGALREAPETKLRLQEILFRLYADLGLQNQAIPLGRSRVALAKSIYGPTHPEVARALVELAADSGESSFANDRGALLQEAGSILDRNRDYQSPVRALYYLAIGNISLDRDLAGSSGFAVKAVELYRRYPPSRQLVSALNLLGQRQNMQGNFRESIASLSQAADVANALQGEARRPLPAIYAVLADSQRRVLDFIGAEQSLRRALQLARSLKGNESVDVIQTQWRLGVFLVQTYRHAEGLALLKETTDLAVRALGPGDSFHTPMVRRAYAASLLRYGQTEEGVSQLEEAIAVGRRANRAWTSDFAMTLEWDALGETELGHYRRAQDLIEEATRIRGNAKGEDPTTTLLARTRLLAATGKAAQAIEVLQRSIPQPGGAVVTYEWMDDSLALAEYDLERDRPEATIERAKAVGAAIRKTGLSQYLERWDARAALLEGKGLLRTRNIPQSLPLLQRAVELGKEVYDPKRSLALADSQIALARCLLAAGRRGQAAELLRRAKAIHATHNDVGDQFTAPLRELEAELRNPD